MPCKYLIQYVCICMHTEWRAKIWSRACRSIYIMRILISNLHTPGQIKEFQAAIDSWVVRLPDYLHLCTNATFRTSGSVVVAVVIAVGVTTTTTIASTESGRGSVLEPFLAEIFNTRPNKPFPSC